MPNREYWVPVQHSGYGYAEKPEFRKGLEPRSCSKKEADLVLKEGGVVFASYGACDDFCEKEMFDDSQGFSMIPNARGGFSIKKIDGLAIYIPQKVSA